MSYLSELDFEFDNRGIFVLSNRNTFEFLDRMQPTVKILSNDLFVTIIQSAPPGMDQADYILDYLMDAYIEDPDVGITNMDDNYIDIITDAIAINNDEIIKQITQSLNVAPFSVPEFIKMVYPYHSIMRILYP